MMQKLMATNIHVTSLMSCQPSEVGKLYLRCEHLLNVSSFHQTPRGKIQKELSANLVLSRCITDFQTFGKLHLLCEGILMYPGLEN